MEVFVGEHGLDGRHHVRALFLLVRRAIDDLVGGDPAGLGGEKARATLVVRGLVMASVDGHGS